MQVTKPCPGLHAKQRLPGHNQTGENADGKHSGSCIAEKEDIGHSLGPVSSPVANEVPAQGRYGENAKAGMKYKSPLDDRVKRSKRYRQAGNQFEEKDGGDSARERRPPTRRRLGKWSSVHLHLGLKKTAFTLRLEERVGSDLSHKIYGE